MKTRWKVMLVLIAAACFAVALSYPIRRRIWDRSAEETMERIIAIRDAALQDQRPSEPNESNEPNEPSATDTETTDQASEITEALKEETTLPEPMQETNGTGAGTPESEENEAPEGSEPIVTEVGEESPNPAVTEQAALPVLTDAPQAATAISRPAISMQSHGSGETEATRTPTPEPDPTSTPVPTAIPTPSPTPAPTVNRFERTGALPYPQKEKRTLDENRILREYRELYELNHDMVGWLTIEGTSIDYPVVQREDNQYYLTHDFLGNENDNGQIILDKDCDPYTPSYNLVLSGHNMQNGQMFSRLEDYFRYRGNWERHKHVQFNTLTERKEYVVIAAFYAADYDVDEQGFRYNVDIQYRVDFMEWRKEVRSYALYETGIEAEFGDEILTLTTCNRTRRRNGRFVVICRRIREGETI